MLAVPLDAPQEGITVTAIGNQTGNTPQNTMDGSLNTRWSQQGATGQWIKYDLGAKKLVSAVDIAFYNGDKRTAYFSIEVSVDNRIFKPVLQNIISSGITNELERYAFSAEEARYVRIVCNGTSEGDWNSITEVRIRYEDLFNSIPIIEDESEKSSNHSSFYIFPNPCEASGDIYLAGLKIFGGLIDVEIIDLRGVVVASKLNQTVPVHLTTITQAGVYLVKITDEKHRQELLKLTVR
ncbi:MAG: discoidin domain-containing protein [Paludibacter sp.]